MEIRSFQPGDEAAQVSIYNEAAALFPRFKPAALDEVRRRVRAADFDPETRYLALEQEHPVGYATFHANGRLSFPWCRKGHEHHAEPLFQTVLQAMRRRGHGKAFAAYRADWQVVLEFFRTQGFAPAREMVNFWLDPADLPTPAARRSFPIAPAQPADVPEILKLAPHAYRVSSPAELEQHLLHNSYFPREAVFVIRQSAEPSLLAAGVLILNRSYADSRQLDAAMPCFRLGAFGTEGMQTKRINGLFSFVAREGRELNPLGLDLLSHAAFKLADTDTSTLAAQVPSDVPHLHRFYRDHFKLQGSFPVLERDL